MTRYCKVIRLSGEVVILVLFLTVILLMPLRRSTSAPKVAIYCIYFSYCLANNGKYYI